MEYQEIGITFRAIGITLRTRRARLDFNILILYSQKILVFLQNKSILGMSNIIVKYSDFENRLIGDELKGYSSIEQFQVYFDEIAKYIFGNVAVVIGDSNSKQIKYYLEEIEFYYNNNKITEDEFTFTTKDGKEKKDKKNYFSCTYKREREAKQLFWHYSGVDICFQSDETCYGGILIRSLTKEYIDNEGNLKRELIAGPLRCSNELINQGVLSNSIPQIEEIKRPTDRIDDVNKIGSTVRQGIETSERYKNILDEIKNEDDRKNHNFPFFCYFIKRNENEWKKAKYSPIPEKRANYIRL
jgi:hypothetical protein